MRLDIFLSDLSVYVGVGLGVLRLCVISVICLRLSSQHISNT
jgi:hypothetical protein